MSRDLSIAIKLLLQDEGVAGKLARFSGQMAGLGKEVEAVAAKNRNLMRDMRAGIDSISRQMDRMARLAQGAFLVFQGAGAVGGILRTAADFESLSLSLKAVLGSAQAAEAEMQRLRETSNRLGIPLQTLTEQYLGFAAAAKGTALEGAQAREVFEAVAEAGTALGLRSDQIAGSLLALQQMMSKGAVSAEEMRQQLGERLYGSLNIAARSIGLTTEQFSDLMERGLLPAAKLLPAFAEQLKRELGGGAADASNSARAAFARLENALLELKLEFARSGFMDAIVDASRQLTGAFADPAFRQSVREFGALIGSLTRFVVEHGDKLVVLGGVLGGARVGASAGRLFGPKGAAVGAGIGAVAGGVGAASLLPDGTASGEDAKKVRDVEAAVARLQRRIEQTRQAERLGTIKPEQAREMIAADEAMIARLKQTREPAAQAGGQAGAAFAQELNRKLLADALKQYATTEEKLAAALAAMKERLKAAGVAEGSKEWQAALAKVRASFAKAAPRSAPRTDDAAARLSLLRSAAEAEFALIKDGLERQKRLLDEALEDRLVSLRDYYAKKTALEQQEIDAERARREQELAAVRALAANPKAGEGERLRALGEVKKLEAEIEILNRRRADVAVENARRQAAAERELAGELARVRDRLAEIKGGGGGEIVRARLEREYQPLIERLQRMGDEAGVADVVRLINVEADLAELSKLERQYQAVMERMAIRERELQVQKDAGMVTEMQMRREVLELHRQTAAEVEGLIPKMQALADKTGSEEAINRVARLKVEVAGLKTEADDVVARINGDVQNAFVSMFEAIGSGTKRASDAFRDFARAVIASLQRIAAQKFAEQIFGGLFGGGGIGGFFSGIFKFASGGPVPGTGNGDTVPALLTPGEFVIRKDAVRRVGLDMLHAINGGGWVPRITANRLAFASGGAVPSVGGTVNNVSVVVNTDTGGRVQADSSSAAELGRRIESAVRGVLMAEKRPGGLLAGA